MKTEIQARLFSMQDPAYQAFQSKLMPTVSPDLVIGVRMPLLRRFAKQLQGMPGAETFLETLPHRYYEENCLHGLLLCASEDYAGTVAALERFLPYVDNWATCDLLKPGAFQQRPPELPGQLRAWALSEHPYTIRFGLRMLMELYLDEPFLPEGLELAAALRAHGYYVDMMRAWYFATALAKQYPTALSYLEQRRLDRWTHNKTIQKAVESYRISPAQKDHLRGLRWR